MYASQITRRDFLKLAGAGALGMALSELRLERAFASPIKHGRMTVSGIPLYDAPALTQTKHMCLAAMKLWM